MIVKFAIAAVVSPLLAVALNGVVRAAETEALSLNLPPHTLKGTPDDLPTGPNIEPYPDKPPTPLLAPKGVKNFAADKPVTSSVKPFTGELNQLTDGKKEPFDYDCVEMKKGGQWIQVDLGESVFLYAVAMWHDHRYIQVMHDVIVQVSDDADFKTGVTTLFNNDTDNSAACGVGTDREYFECEFGRVVDGKGTKARYVRGYTRGGSMTALNCWQEIEVYALPAGSRSAVLFPTSAIIETPPPVIIQSTEFSTVSVGQVETAPAEAAPHRTVQNTSLANRSVHFDRAPVNVNATTHIQVSIENSAPAPQPVAAATSVPPVTGFSWIGAAMTVFSAGVLLVGIRALLRDPTAARGSISRAK